MSFFWTKAPLFIGNYKSFRIENMKMNFDFEFPFSCCGSESCPHKRTMNISSYESLMTQRYAIFIQYTL